MRTPVFVRASLLGLAAALLTALPATAQQTGRVTGLVTAAGTGRVVDGAQVYIEGSRIGALSTAEGRYLLLNVPVGEHTVRVDMIGFRPATQLVTVSAGGTTTADFSLSESAVAIDEIVVTGTAAATRAREVGNSLEAISSREFENLPVINSAEVLQGRAAGVTVMGGSGQPGTGSTVKIRANQTATTAPEPLIYIDGIRVYNLPMGTGGGARVSQSPLQDIDAADIERMEVIKGASATTLYGTEAAGGVVQIFTKKGSSGAPMWTADIGLGLSSLPPLGAESDPTELYTNCDMTDLMFGLDTFNSDLSKRADRVFFEDPTCPSSGTWDGTGFDQRYNLSVRGGFGDITYYVSGTYNGNDGTLPSQKNQDGTFRGNFDFAPSNSLRFALSTAYTRRDSDFVEDGNNSNGFLLNVGRGHQNYLKGGLQGECDAVDPSKVCITNGYLFDAENSARHDHFVSGFTINWTPAVTTHRIAFGWDYTDRNARFLRNFGDLRSPEGFLNDYNTRHTKLSVDYAGSWIAEFAGGDFASTFSWGGQIFQDQHRFVQIDVDGFAGPGEQTLETGADLTGRTDNRYNTNSAGFFLQEQLGYRDFLFATIGARVDGNSAFGDDYGLQFYPKFSMSYVMSDHDWFPSWWETFKLRGAIGESGKAPNQFAKFRTWEPVAGYVEPGFTPGDPGNEEVGPERTSELEFGFDASWFQGRLGLEFTRWTATTNDALVSVTLPPSEGFTQSLTSNIGTIEGDGWEMTANAGLLRTENFDWDVYGTLSLINSNVADLGGQIISDEIMAEFREGYPAPAQFGREILNAEEFAEPILSDEDVYLGDVFPDEVYSLGSNVTLFRNLTADVLFEYQGGFTLPNYTGYQNARRGAWRPCFETQEKIVDFYVNGNQSALDGVTARERAKCAIRGVGPSPNRDFWLEEADFLKLRSFSLSYAVPQQYLGNWFNSATLTLGGRNLVTWSDFGLYDPEVEDFGDRGETNYDGEGDFGRRDYYTIPNPRRWMFSVRLGF